MQFVEVDICGVNRKFPVVSMGPRLRVASVTLLGDVELVEVAAKELVKLVKKWQPEVLVGPETKVVPLLQKMCELLKLPRYVVCRKGIQPYMIDPVVVEPQGLRNRRVRVMAIDGRDAQYLHGKKAVVVDDVIFTGGSFGAMRQLLAKSGAKYLGVVAVFKQGDRFEFDCGYLRELPVFEG